MNILISQDEPYAVLIEQYLAQQFPSLVNITGENLVDVLTTILIGNKDTRFGPTKSPESLVVIRDVIRESIDNNVPIPVLIPWGSMKCDYTSNIDIAEVLSIATLVKLCEAVKRVYAPGLSIRIRVEDYSGMQIFSYPKPIDMKIISIVEDYCTKIENLIKILGDGNSIEPIRENSMKHIGEFLAYVDAYTPIFKDYLSITDGVQESEMTSFPQFSKLKEIGWNGIIPQAQRQYYYDTYVRLYNSNPEESIERLSIYMAQALVRKKLDMTGKGEWSKFIQLTFCPPVPGVPTGYDHNFIYYRTVPISQARTHICPWRAKGYLRISGDKVCSKICSLTEYKEKELNPSTLTLTKDELSVVIDSTYMLV